MFPQSVLRVISARTPTEASLCVCVCVCFLGGVVVRFGWSCHMTVTKWMWGKRVSVEDHPPCMSYRKHLKRKSLSWYGHCLLYLLQFPTILSESASYTIYIIFYIFKLILVCLCSWKIGIIIIIREGGVGTRLLVFKAFFLPGKETVIKAKF